MVPATNRSGWRKTWITRAMAPPTLSHPSVIGTRRPSKCRGGPGDPTRPARPATPATARGMGVRVAPVVETSPYGTWISPISAADVASVSGGPQWLDRVGGEIWWAQARPGEGGRIAVVRGRAGGSAEEMLPAPWNA